MNTGYMFMRIIVTLILSFYTSRVVLHQLGIVDFGIYNVVGGVASMFVFFSSSLTNASQRFFNIAIGKNNLTLLKQTFSVHFFIYAAILLLIISIAEPVGIWFIKEKLIIPESRLQAALMIYQFSIASMAMSFMGIVFNACIIAHEDMKIYSYIGVFEAFSKLGIALILTRTNMDKLILYSFLYLLATALTLVFYMGYCIKNYEECKLMKYWNRNIFKSTFSMISWNAIGTAVYALNDQGLNILLNMFFGPAVNTARGITYQISGAITKFSTNFLQVVNPQIVKSYAQKDINSVKVLFYRSSRYSVYLLFVLSFPVMFSIDEILQLWLINVPEYTSVFTIWVLIMSIFGALYNPVWVLDLATGKLKKYMVVISCFSFLAFPICYIFLLWGNTPTIVFAILALFRFLLIFVGMNIVKQYIRELSYFEYIKKVLYPIVSVAIVALAIPFLCYCLFAETLVWSIFLFLITFCSVIFSIILIGLEEGERSVILDKIKKKFK